MPKPHHPRVRRPGSTRWPAGPPILAAILTPLIAGCDLPTEPPRYTTVWEAVLLHDSVSTAALLPDEVGLHPDGGFTVESYTSSSEVRLEDVCEFCTCFEGPIPELEITPYDWRLRLPSRLLEAQVTAGTARVVLHNDAGFDILDDGEGGRGYIQIALVDTRTATTVDSARVDRAFPDGDSVAVEFDLSGLRLGNSLVARVSGRTPGTGSDSVDLSVESGFRTEVQLREVRAPSVLVVLSDADLEIVGRAVDLPRGVAERLRPGEAEVWVEVEADTRLPVSTELELSVASRIDQLFTATAALFTPLILPSGLDEPTLVRKRFVVDVSRLPGTGQIHLDARNRILGNRIVTLRGTESVVYSLTLHAELPTR